jgi:hypothetical protein
MTDNDVIGCALFEGWKPGTENSVRDAVAFLAGNGHKLYEILPEDGQLVGPRCKVCGKTATHRESYRPDTYYCQTHALERNKIWGGPITVKLRLK